MTPIIRTPGYLLDTNIVIPALTGDPVIKEFIEKSINDRIFIYSSVITIAEVYAGAKPS